MISDILNETLSFIKEFAQKNGRPPRLKELQARFSVTNKAILDRLQGLENEGLIDMPDGVLSMRVRDLENDIFISYSEADKVVAQKIYDYFVDEGFKVWKDNMKLENGKNFVSEIFDNIRRSKAFILLLSGASLKSSFVREEVSCAKKSHIDHKKPVILPIKVKDDYISKDAFPEITSLHHIKLNEDCKDEDLVQIANQIHKLAYDHQDTTSKKMVGTNGLHSFVKKVISDLESEIKSATQPPNKIIPYKQFILAPIGEVGEHKNNELEKIVKDALVKIDGWGGDRFPGYYYDYGRDVQLMQGWIRSADLKPWPGDKWNMDYWAFDSKLNFFSRTVFREAFTERQGLQNKISVEWVTFDISRVIIFLTHLRELTGIKRWKLFIEFNDIKGRELTILSTRRFGLMNKYTCGENKIYFELEIDENKDLKGVVFDICYEILQLFNWRNPNQDILTKDIAALIDYNRFPE